MRHLSRAYEAVSQILASSRIDLVRSMMHLNLMITLEVKFSNDRDLCINLIELATRTSNIFQQADIGGSSHRSAGGVQHAGKIERDFGNLTI